MADTFRSHRIPVPDARILAVDDYGPRDAPVVIAHHGTPSCRLDVPGGAATPDQIGVRVITFDRPGYGLSTDLPGRSVSDAAANARAICDALDIEQFATIGVSGGGPHALATAALLPDRVTKVCVSVGLGPVEDPQFDLSAGMLPETLDELKAVRSGPGALRAFIAEHADPATGLDPWIEQLPRSDCEVLARPAVQAAEQAIATEWQRASIDGWVEDDLALFARPWGFAVADVAQPTLLLYGEADVLVPVSHGRALNRLIAGSRLVTIAGGGHWLLDHEALALRWLTGTGDKPSEQSSNYLEPSTPLQTTHSPS
jgi:pimeloyl-ACP methyl ester carboxylesterase